jgi:ubiquinone/menaquinone biosynthesis C-methylase UbiE
MSKMSGDPLLDATFEAERHHFWFKGLRRFLRPLLAEAAGGRTDRLILDCGCGTGANLALLAQYGSAYGIDYSMRGVRRAREYNQARTALATVTSLPFPSNRFDIVTSLDVLITLADADERLAAREMYRVLRPGGTAIVNVAALDILRGNHSVLSREVRRYTRRRLRAVLMEAGFEIRRLTFTNAVLFPFVLATRTMDRIRRLETFETVEASIPVPPAPINAAFSGLLALESGLLRWMDMPLGSSLLCVARRPGPPTS